MSKDSIISKIQKLLALAGNNPNQHERERAMEAAMELLDAHNLEMDDVENFQGNKPGETRLKIPLNKWRQMLVQAACELYCCRFYLCKPPRGSSYNPVLIGTAENRAVCAQIIDWLIKSVAKESNKSYTEESKRKAFRLGAALMIGFRASQIVKERLAQNEASTGTSLMVLRHSLQKANDDYMKEIMSNAPTQRSRSTHVEGYAFAQGLKYGATVGLERQLGKDTDKTMIGGES
jgi:hypothetical protein